MGEHRWVVGDRVVWPHGEGHGRARTRVLTPGTVVAVDLPGQPRGVLVRLDRCVNGLDSCYATHRELEPEPASPDTTGEATDG